MTALGACGSLLAKGPHVPTAYEGTAPITVANAADRDLCVFSLFQDQAPSENWLGAPGQEAILAPGERHTFMVRPGAYHVRGAFCGDGHVLGTVGTSGSATATIYGPSLIALGAKPVKPIPDAQMFVFDTFFAPAAGEP